MGEAQIRQTRCLIGGRWIDADDGPEFPVHDPATGLEIARVPNCRGPETRRAIEAAAEALPAWREKPALERGQILRRWAESILREQERLARLMTAEQGKPLAEARGEIASGASYIEWAAEEGRRIYGETIPASSAGKRIFMLRQPVGVTAAITPWNFPMAMIARKAGPALACGCTIVIKPAEQTPLSAIALGELAIEAGVPGGVLSIVTGDAPAIGAEMLANPLVRKLSFTGSTEVGKLLMRQASQNLTRLSLELGGHAPLIVFDDADIEPAVKGAIASKFRNAGQTCICINRILVQSGIYDRFIERLTAAARALKVGNGLEPGVQIGPLIDDGASEKARAHVADAVARGGRVLCGGAAVAVGGASHGRFFAPTVIDGLTPQMLCWREETFAPLAPVMRFTTEPEAIRLANDTPFGLAAYFFTRDASRLMRVAEALDYGIVGANDTLPTTAQAPFGGVKQSGFGREGGRHVMHEYTSVKYVSWGIDPAS